MSDKAYFDQMAALARGRIPPATPDGPSPKVARGATLSIESHRVPDDGTQHDLSQRCSCGPTIRVEHHEREGQ